jgi:cellulose synthase/poly-beta-1,6-N-acetylglucosamine synthase-like glycosyltransferase
MLDAINEYYSYIIFFYGNSLALSYLFLSTCSIIAITKYKSYNTKNDDNLLLTSPLSPGISVVAPAYNEEASIIGNVNSLLTLNYPLYEVIIINDGSKDKTLEKLIDAFELEETAFAYEEKIVTKPFKRVFKSRNPKFKILTVVDKENGGTKADASNAGINAAVFPYFLCTDVDCILNRDVLLKMIKPILNTTSDQVIAVGATLRMSNSCKIENGQITKSVPPRSLIPRFQEVEYLRAYILSKVGWGLINCVPNVSGGLGLFDKSVAEKAGGYDGTSHAEDMDMITRMSAYMIHNNQKYRVSYIPVSCCWTEGPPDVKVLSAQRKRWGRGLIQLFVVHRRYVFNPKYGRMGMIIFPYILIFEFLAPVIEFCGLIFFLVLIIFGKVNWQMASVIFLYSYSFAVFYSLLAIALDQYVEKQYQSFYDVFKLFIISFLEPFYYHPMVMYFSVRGYIDYIVSKEFKWGTMTRQGFDTE